MKLTLKTLTPIHIGNGEELYELDYVIYNKKYYRITQKQFLSFIGTDSNLATKYADWVEASTAQMEELKTDIDILRKEKNRKEVEDYNQKLSRLKSSFNLLSFSRQVNKENEFVKFLDSRDDIYKFPTRETIGKRKVRGHIKSGNNQFYIPGTSIKGAVRTALMYHFLCNYASKNEIKRIIDSGINQADGRNDNDKRLMAIRFADKIEHLCFYCSLNDKRDDEKMDLMKLVTVADGMFSDFKGTLSKVNLYLVQREQKGSDAIYLAKEQIQTPFVEAIDKGSTIHSSISFNIEFLFGIKNKIKEGNTSFIEINDDKVWVGIVEKVKKLFGIDIQKLNADNLEDERNKVIQHLLNCVFTFSKAQKEKEQQWYENYIKHDKDEQYFPHMKYAYDNLKAGNLIHLGYATGFNGTTEILYLLNDNDLKSSLKRLMEVFGIGDKPGANKQRREGDSYTANPDKFPKSRRMISDDSLISPMGWMEIVGFDSKTNAFSVVKEKEKVVIAIQYPKGTIKQSTALMATLVTSGTPNIVLVHFAQNNAIEMELSGYRSAINEEKVGTLLWVKVLEIKAGKVSKIGFIKFT